MSVINTNVKALYTQGALKVSGRESTVAMQQLSTGKRINSAKDDAAGLAIATRMTQQIRSLNQAVRNAGDAISLIQVAEGATMEITDMLQRMRELAIQAINDTNAGEQRAYLDLEFQQLKQEIVRISDTTEWNGFSILNGTVGERVGERPVYKTTAQSEFGQVMINPTTVRAISGADAGEQQTVKFTGTATTGGLLTVGGVDVQVTSGDTAAVMAAKAKVAMEATSAFAPNTNRNIVVDGETLRITFPYSEKNVPKIGTSVSAGLTGVTIATNPSAVSAQAQIDAVTLTGDIAVGDKVAVAVNGANIELTSATTDKNVFAQAIADAFNTSSSSAHQDVTAVVGNGSASKVTANVQFASYDYTFTPITSGQTVTIAGLTFTAGTNGASGADLAAAFGTGKSGIFASGSMTGTVTTDLAVEKLSSGNIVRFSDLNAAGDPGAASGTGSSSVTAATNAAAASAQSETTFTLSDKFVAGQDVSIVLNKTPNSNGVSVTYRVLAADIGSTDEQTRANVATKLAAAYNADTNATVALSTATASNNTILLRTDNAGTKLSATFSATAGVINFTADVPGKSFTASAAATPVSITGTLVAARSAQQVNIAADEPAPNRIEAISQVDAIKLGGSIGAGGNVTVTVGGADIVVTALGNDDAASLGNRLADTFNASTNDAHKAITAKLGTGILTKTTPFSNVSGVREVATLTVAGNLSNTDTLTIAGVTFTATGATTPAQVADQIYKYITFGTAGVNGTITGTPNAEYTASLAANGKLVLTAVNSGAKTNLTVTGTANNALAGTDTVAVSPDGVTAVAQVDSVSFGNEFVVGQDVTLTVAGQPITLTVSPTHIGASAAATRTNVANALRDAFNASTNAAHTQITASVTNGGVLQLTADTAGSGFTTTVSAETGVVSFTADTAGTPFTTSVSATSTVTAALRHTQPNVRAVSGEAITSTVETFSNNGKFLRSGALNISLSAAGVVASSFTTTDYQVVPLTGVLDEAAGTITFTATGDNSKILSDALTYTFKSDNGNIVPLGGREVVLDVGVVGSIPVMGTGDLIINGVTINASYAADDTLSPPNNAAGSAIAKAAAINRESLATGVNAVVNTNIMAGTAQSGTSAVTGRVVINGVTSPTFTTVMNNTRASRIAAVDAINRISDITGVVAVNSNSESEGIALVAKDGRNIEVSFDTADSAADFSARTGLREGVQAGTFSLESRVEGPIVITTSATGNVHNAGLTVGDYTANVSTMSTVTPDVVPGNTLPVALGTGDLVINGVPIRGATAADDKFTERAALLTTSNVSTGSGIAFANAVNASSELTGVTATANPVVALGSRTTINSATPDGFKSLFVNGVDVRVEFKATHTASERVQAVINAINPLTGPAGVTASANLQGGVTFTTLDGRNLSVWFDDTNISAAEFGLATQGGANVDGVSGKSTAPTLANASTLYGGVTFHSAKAFTIEPGGNGYGPNSNFTALGLTEGTFGGVVDSATSKMTPPNTGRLSFHVGASANQIITIDLSDFGDGGTITSDITGDVDLWDSDKRVNRIDTGAAAAATLEKLDAVMDKVNGTRATMGAVMNRLEHVIDNLMNVSMNTEASRSQIEDADYAAASTELARTQIMQQAATSVLAQANADQQNVLKLLQ
jgi:flagellin